MSEKVATGKEYLKGWTPYAVKRYYFYIALTIVFVGATVDYGQRQPPVFIELR
jgi:hypothetical protein